MATIREVSRLARVSMATVSRVLNGNAPVASETRQRVMAAVEQLGYRPNALARGLATNRSGGVGVIVNDLASPFFGPMLRGIETVIEAEGMHLMVSSGHAQVKAERAAIDFLMQRHVDVIIAHVEEISDTELLTLHQQGVPLVLVGRYVPELAQASVHLDNERGGYLATRYLLERGHRRIAHITGPLSIHDGRERLLGYRQALEEAGIRYDEDLVVESDFLEEGGRVAAERLLARATRFSALFVGNDQMAAGALTALRGAKLEVPRDISLVGYDDVLLARYLYPALTTVGQPVHEMGQAAARIALAALKGESGEGVTRRFEPALVERDSVAPAPGEPAAGRAVPA